MRREDRELLSKATRIGKTVRFMFPSDRKRRNLVGEVVDEVSLIRDRHKIVIQQVRYTQQHLWDDAELGYRIGYFRIAGRWGKVEVRWSNRSMLLSEVEVDFLLKQAAQKGWRIPGFFG